MNDTALPRRVSFGELSFSPRFAYGDQAEISEVTGTQHGTVLGTGVARFSNTSIPWRAQYDEVLLVIEGRLITVRADDGDFMAGPMDCVWLPKGTALRYEAGKALVFYAIHPNNWAEMRP